MTDEGIPPLLATFLERLDARLTGGEALALEFKRATGGLPRNIWETVSAFANTSGGWILLGVDDEARPVAVEGVPNASGALQTFWNQMRNRQKISAEVCGAGDAAIEPLGAKRSSSSASRPPRASCVRPTSTATPTPAPLSGGTPATSAARRPRSTA